MRNLRCLILVGPTASGKSDLAVELAEKLDAEIVNLDSIQVYRQLNIGAAKPSIEMQNRVPHHLFDIVDPDQELTAGEFRRKVLSFLQSYQKENVILVGGSGFYLRAVLYGMYDSPKPTPEVRSQVSALSGGEAYRQLQQRDAEYAAKLSPNDLYRVQRALENILTTGKTVSQIQKEFEARENEFPHSYWIAGLKADKLEIRKRVEARTKLMLKAGFVDEVRALVENGFTDCRPMKSVGYKEVVAMLRGELSETELERSIVQSTMKLVKKQMTFFRGQFPVHWFDLPVTSDSVLAKFPLLEK